MLPETDSRRLAGSAAFLAVIALSVAVFANSTAQAPPFTQGWSNPALISVANDWSAVPGIVGYRGDALTGSTGADPQTILGEGTAVVNVLANQTNPNTNTTGGVAEFDTLANPTVAFQGSGTARAPNLVITLDASSASNINVSYNLRDIDGSADNAIQPVALQYRVGITGNFTNVPAGFVADATTGPSLATLVTSVSATLPAAANNQPIVQVRIITADAAGSDEWVGIDDISITALSSVSLSGVGAANPSTVVASGTSLLTVVVTPASSPASTGITVTADLTSIGGGSSQALFDDGTHGDVTAGDNVFTYLAPVPAATTPGAKALPVSISDAEARTASAGISLTVAPPPSPSTSLVVSQVYGGGGNSGSTYKNDFIEIFNLGPTTVNVAGWSVQYASASGTGSWQTTPLTGSILPGRFYLVQEAAGAGGTVALPAPDAVGAIAMSGTSGKVALVSSTTALVGACPLSASIVDVVGYGSANCSETTPTAPLDAATAAIRNGNGSIDTNDNASDFTLAAPAPSNSTGRPPLGLGAAAPASASAGESTLLTVTVTPGGFPSAGGLTVVADLSALSGSSTQAFYDDGTQGDANAADNVFSYQVTIPSGSTVGSKTLPFLVTDSLARSSSGSIGVIVEPPVIAIHEIQGPGAMSPLNGQLVATRGVVVGRKFNGFFIQTPDAEVDADPFTSEGVFVFTNNSSSPATGTLVKVAGTVSEFIPPQDLASPPTTEIGGSPSVTVLATSEPLPTAYTLTAADTLGTSFDNLERFEGMRVRVDTLRTIAPTQHLGGIDETNNRATTNGVFFGVIDSVARPAREEGINGLDPLPTGAPCCVPRFDENPERIRIDSDGQPGATPLDVTSGAILSDLVGSLEFSFRAWTILPDPAAPPSLSGLMTAVPVPLPSVDEFTVGAFNMERFFDTVDDPLTSDPVLTPLAFAGRLNKASLAVRNVMRTPDILGVEEMENLSTLQALADKINTDAVAAGDPNPGYAAFLEEGNDIGGIDSGFLVKTSKVNVLDVNQVGKTATYVNPNTGAPDLLNDRPPLILRAQVQAPVGAPVPLTVIVNHLRSLNGVDDETPDGSGTAGGRVRAKRQAQAEFLADLIQARQTADPAEFIISVGDYNAFAQSDGLVDLMGTIKGTPTDPDHVVLASADHVEPNLTNLVDLLPPDQGYSYSFDGNIQTLDHVLVNAALMKRYSRFHYARNDADFPEVYRNDPDRPERLSDHDMPVAYFAFPGAPTLNLLGPNPMTVECGSAFVDPGASASDADLGDLTSSIVVTGSIDAHAVGAYVLTYSVSNGYRVTTLTRTVNVVDTTPPALSLLGPASMTLELGDAFTDPGAVATDTCAGDLTSSISVSGSVNTAVAGVYTLVYTVSDGFNTAQVSRTVNVVDTTSPDIATITPSPHVLWPPDGRMVPVVVTVDVTDASNTAVCRITGVTSDEPSRGRGDDRGGPDWRLTGSLTLDLRAEREGRGDGRTYTITVECRDASGNTSLGTATVIVPHDRGRGGPSGHGHFDGDGCERQHHPRPERKRDRR